MALTKIPLSGSTNGKAILVSTAVAGSAVTVHTAQSGTTYSDHPELFAQNNDTANTILLTVLWGGTTEPDDAITVFLEPQAGPKRIVPRRLIQNSLIVKAYAGTANKITIFGDVLRES